MDAHHIEFTTPEGACKWVHNVVSHSKKDIIDAWGESEMIELEDRDGCTTCVDLDHVFAIRFQDESTYRRRSKEVKGNGSRRRRSQPVRRRGFQPKEEGEGDIRPRT